MSDLNARMETAFVRKRARSLWREAQTFQHRGNVEKAIDLYQKSIAVHPTAEAHTFLAWAYRFQNKIDDAIEECKKAIEVDPTFGNPYNDIGSYLVMKGQLDEAIVWLEAAKDAPRYEPRHFPYMNLGRIYAAKGLILRALHEFRDALKIRPGEPTCLRAVAHLRAELN